MAPERQCNRAGGRKQLFQRCKRIFVDLVIEFQTANMHLLMVRLNRGVYRKTAAHAHPSLRSLMAACRVGICSHHFRRLRSLMPSELFAPSSLHEKKQCFRKQCPPRPRLPHRLRTRDWRTFVYQFENCMTATALPSCFATVARTCRGCAVGTGGLSRRRDGLHGPDREARCPRGVPDHAGRRACGDGARHLLIRWDTHPALCH